MRLKKLLLNSLITGILSIATFSTFAGLTVSNHSKIQVFSVTCTNDAGKQTQGVDIHSNQTATLPWNLIWMILDYRNNGTCAFTSNGKVEAIASISIAPTLTSASITNLDIRDPKLHVSSNPGVHVSRSEITVTVTGG